MGILNVIACLFASYCIGSIPTAYLAGRLCKGIDIRQYGSGNVGATNAFRVLGKGPGVAVFLVDAIKGFIVPAFLTDFFMGDNITVRLLASAVVVVGHNWTIFLQFKGGKGIATSLGVLIGLALKFTALRPVMLATICVWIFVFLLSGFVSLASLVSAVILPILMVITNQPFEITALGIIFCLFVVIRHRSNINRLLHGKESRFQLVKKRNA